MCPSTPPTSPDPNTRPSRGTPPAPRNRTGSDIESASVRPNAGKAEVTCGDGETEEDGPPDPAGSAQPARASPPPAAAAIDRVRISPRDTNAPPGGFSRSPIPAAPIVLASFPEGLRRRGDPTHDLPPARTPP